jgi:SAM-dependent methyltransferase
VFDHPDAPEFSHARYLRAKESVDDRALHRPTLAAARAAATEGDRLRVFEAGPGLGASLRRLLRWDLPPETTYRGVDADADAVAGARDRLPDLAAEAGYDIAGRAPATLTDGERSVTVRFETGDALAAAPATTADLVVAAAFVDLFDPDEVLAALRGALAPGGVAYLPVVFDGVTAFDPPHDADDRVLDAYHATMDAPNRPGGSESGRALLGALRESDATLAAAGGSDWLVTPPYPADEAYFCHHLVGVVERAVTRAESAAEPDRARVPDAVARTWAADRHAAVADGDLTLLVHNLDVLVRAPA